MDLGHPPTRLILYKKIAPGICPLGENFYPKFEIFAIVSYLSPQFYTHNVKILFIKRMNGLLRIHQGHKISSKSFKGPAVIALPRGGDAY